MPHRAVLAGVRDELRALQRDTRAGWTADTVARGLSAARIVGSYLGGYPVSQRTIKKELINGELSVSGGMMSRRRVAVSGATTAFSLGRGTAPVPADLAASDLDSALLSLTRARYGRIDKLDGSELDDALATTTRAADRVASRHTWLAESAALIMRSLSVWKPRAWAR